MIERLREMVLARHTNRPDEAFVEAALGLASEAGEVDQLVRKVRYEGHTRNDGELLMEMGDVLHYLLMLCALLDVSLETVARCNVDKLAALDMGRRAFFETAMVTAAAKDWPADSALADVERTLERVTMKGCEDCRHRQRERDVCTFTGGALWPHGCCFYEPRKEAKDEGEGFSTRPAADGCRDPGAVGAGGEAAR